MYVDGSAFALAAEDSGGNGFAGLRKHPHLERPVRREGRKIRSDQDDASARADKEAPARRMRGFAKRDLFRGGIVQNGQRLFEPAGGNGIPVSRNNYGRKHESERDGEPPGKPDAETPAAAGRADHCEHATPERARRLGLMPERRHGRDHGGRLAYAMGAGGALLREMLDDPG